SGHPLSTAERTILWRRGGLPVEELQGAVEDTPSPEKSREKYFGTPCAAARGGIELCLPNPPFAAGVGRTEGKARSRACPGRRPVAVMAGSESCSGRSGATARSSRGSWCSYHREPLTLFHAPLTELAKSTIRA